MKKSKLLFFILFVPILLHAQDWEELNSKVEDFIDQGNYDEAMRFAEKAKQHAIAEFGQEHENYATSLDKMASVYKLMGDYESALPLSKEALDIRLRILGEEHPDYAQSLNNLAGIYKSMGDYELALPLSKEALDIRHTVLGKEHPDYAQSLNNLAGIYYSMGNNDSALSLNNEALDIRLRVLGKEHPDYASSLNSLAIIYYSMGNYDSALPMYKEALDIRLRVLGKKHPDYATSLSNLAALYESMGDYDSALPLYKDALEIRLRELGKEHPDYATSLNNLGGLYQRMGDYDSALLFAKEARDIWSKVLGKEHPNYARSISNLAILYESMGDYDSALSLKKEALDIRLRVLGKEHPDYATSLNNLAVLYHYMGDYKSALPLLEEALDIRLMVLGKEHPDYASSVNTLAAIYYYMGDYESALPLFRESLEITLRLNGKNHPDYATSLHNLASLYQYLGEYEKALSLYKEALNIKFRVLGKEHPANAYSLNSLALLHTTLGDYESALALSKEALDIRLAVHGNEHPDYAGSINTLAGIYKSMGDYESALPLFMEAREIWLKVLGKEHPAYAISLNNLAELYRLMGEYESALPLSMEALDIRLKVLGKEHPDYASSLNNLALIYMLSGDYNSALPLFEEARDIVLKVMGKEHAHYAKSLYNLALLYNITNDYFKSKDNFIQSIKILKSNFNILDVLSEKEKIYYLENNKDYFHGFYSVCPHLYNQDKSISSDLFNVRLSTQGILLTSSKEIKKTIIESNDLELIDLYNEYVSSKNSLAKAFSLTGEAELNLKINVDSLEEISNSHERELAKRTRVFEKHLKKRNYTWEDIRDKLKPNEAAVSLLRYPYYNKVKTDTIQYAALLVTQETISNPTLIVLGNGPELEEKYVAQYYGSILPGNDSSTEHSCYQVFWEEIEKEIEDKDVVYFCPDGVYHMINLNALQYPDGKYLYEKKDIVILNSLMEILEEEERSVESRSALLVGSPEYSLDKESQQQLAANFANKVSTAGSYPLTRDYRNYSLQELPGTKIEIEEINGLLESHNWSTKCYIGKQALEEVIKSGENPQVLHIATHGFFTKSIHDDRREKDNLQLLGKSSMKAVDNPLLRSGLMFSGSQNTLDGKHDPLDQLDDGILTGYEAMDLDLSNTELVILSACETGLGELMDGEGVYGLQRAFKIAGVNNIIMSLWKVDDNATQLLMRKFYEFWLAGNSKREAFKMAQDHLRTQTVYKEPYYWGGFVYIGMDRPGLPVKTNQLLWLLALILPLGLVIYYRKRIFRNR